MGINEGGNVIPFLPVTFCLTADHEAAHPKISMNVKIGFIF